MAFILTAEVHETNLPYHRNGARSRRARPFGPCPIVWPENEKAERADFETGAAKSESEAVGVSDPRHHPHCRFHTETARLFDGWRRNRCRWSGFFRQARTRNSAWPF